MQRVRKFLVINEDLLAGSKLPEATLSSASQCEGWHQTWDAAVQLMETNRSLSALRSSEPAVTIADGSEFLVVAIFSHRNLESLDPGDGKTKWRSVMITSGHGYWCNFNYSDYGWGWVSGAKREVPFRLRFFERQSESNPSSLISRARAWILEARDWFHGHDKKIG